jgi:hypothetical protein
MQSNGRMTQRNLQSAFLQTIHKRHNGLKNASEVAIRNAFLNVIWFKINPLETDTANESTDRPIAIKIKVIISIPKNLRKNN